MRLCLIAIIVAASAGAFVLAQDEPEAGFEGAERFGKQVRRIGPHLYELGAVTIDAKSRTVRCSGRVNMAEGGPIELLACLPRGKVHESVLTLDVEPLDLQVALLLLGLEPGRNPAAQYPDGSPELEKAPGDMVEVCVEWQEPAPEGTDKVTVRRRADELLYNVAARQPLDATTWAFVGSCWVRERFGADIEGSLIATYHDPLAILELPVGLVNDDTWCTVRSDAVPPAGTKVELIIQQPAESKSSPAKEGSDG